VEHVQASLFPADTSAEAHVHVQLWMRVHVLGKQSLYSTTGLALRSSICCAPGHHCLPTASPSRYNTHPRHTLSRMLSSSVHSFPGVQQIGAGPCAACAALAFETYRVRGSICRRLVRQRVRDADGPRAAVCALTATERERVAVTRCAVMARQSEKTVDLVLEGCATLADTTHALVREERIRTHALVREERIRTLSGLPHLAREVMVAGEAGCLDANSMPTQLLGSLVHRLQQPNHRNRLTEAEQYFYGMLLNSGNVYPLHIDFPTSVSGCMPGRLWCTVVGRLWYTVRGCERAGVESGKEGTAC